MCITHYIMVNVWRSEEQLVGASCSGNWTQVRNLVTGTFTHWTICMVTWEIFKRLCGTIDWYLKHESEENLKLWANKHSARLVLVNWTLKAKPQNARHEALGRLLLHWKSPLWVVLNGLPRGLRKKKTMERS